LAQRAQRPRLGSVFAFLAPQVNMVSLAYAPFRVL
jgi:hypothetical protein